MVDRFDVKSAQRVTAAGSQITYTGAMVRHSDYAALEAQFTKRVKVKPLEWKTSPADKSIAEPRTYYGFWEGGYYHVSKSGHTWSVGTFTNRGQSRHIGFFRTLDEAKAVAQADYERRILSALTAAQESGE